MTLYKTLSTFPSLFFDVLRVMFSPFGQTWPFNGEKRKVFTRLCPFIILELRHSLSVKTSKDGHFLEIQKK